MTRQSSGETSSSGVMDWVRKHRTESVAATALSGVLLAGCSSPTEAKPSTVAASTATPGESKPSSSIDTTISPVDRLNPETALDGELFKSLTAEQQAKIQKYHAMSLEEFQQKVGDEDQLVYGQFVFDAYAAHAEQQIKTQVGFSLTEYTPLTAPLSGNSSGQDILNQRGMIDATAMWMMSESQSPYAHRAKNYVDAQKMIVALNCKYQEGQCAQQMLDMLSAATTGLLAYGSDGYYGGTAMEEGPVDNGRKVIDNLYNNSTTQDVYHFQTFKDIQGKERANWSLNHSLSQGSQGWVKL